jgi:hypothetical protein
MDSARACGPASREATVAYGSEPETDEEIDKLMVHALGRLGGW